METNETKQRKTFEQLFYDSPNMGQDGYYCLTKEEAIALLHQVRTATLKEAAEQTRHDCGILSLDPNSIEL
tara:strand:+ start:382 stop:594 length:213 start_codon:yes stop_codon:yes gene_type:complete